LIPRFWHETLYSEMIAFLSILSDNFWLDEFKHAIFKVLTRFTSGAILDVNFTLLGIILS
jgi:hypothetical protein